MKLEPLFTARDNKLYSLKTGEQVSVDLLFRVNLALVCGTELEPGARAELIQKAAAEKGSLLAIEVPWSIVELPDGSYNESVLAFLRDFLKDAEAAGIFAFIIPSADEDSGLCSLMKNGVLSAEQSERFTQAMSHTARRIKDCVSVIGFAVPSEFISAGFGTGSAASAYISALSEKHAQYVYFSAADTEKTDIVRY